MTAESYPLARTAKRFAVAALVVVLARTALSENGPRDSLVLAAVVGAGAATADYALWRRSRTEPATTIEMDDQPADAPVDTDEETHSDLEEQAADD